MFLSISDTLINLGMAILPYSFGFYLPVRFLEFVWQKGYTKLVKGIWYFCLGMTYVIGSPDSDTIVMYICFIEAIDLFFAQLESKKK